MKVRVIFILSLFLSCSKFNKCNEINSTITQEQNAIDLFFVKQVEDKNNEIQEVLFDEEIPYEEKTNRLQNRMDSLYKSAYQSLKKNNTFRQKGLYGNISLTGRTILLYNKKYKELDSLLQKNTCFTSFEDDILRGQVTFLAYQEINHLKALKAIQKVDKIIEGKLPKKLKEDNIENIALFYHYVTNRALWKGKEIAYKTIDSLVKKNEILEPYSQDMKEQCNNVLLK
ncbi:hypothetical protein [Capnocytophaga canis]|uniref:hypothetical protein n=1 Tax=Capnocytophaga canis TaxID=1848903 RepID=UPI0037CE3A16